jgi:hypothetical protein
MTLPGYSAEASFHPTSWSYLAARGGQVAAAAVVAQHDPCARPSGGGGGGIPPGPCPRGQRCCEPLPGGRCLQCVPMGAQCP